MEGAMQHTAGGTQVQHNLMKHPEWHTSWPRLWHGMGGEVPLDKCTAQSTKLPAPVQQKAGYAVELQWLKWAPQLRDNPNRALLCWSAHGLLQVPQLVLQAIATALQNRLHHLQEAMC